MAIVNSNYEFIYIDVGKQGRLSDGEVIEATSFFHKLNDGTLNLPENEENDGGLNFVFVADEALSLHKNIIKPYSQRDLNYERRIYNYRLSRARNVVENAFGIMSSRFRILRTDINLSIEKINYVVSGICVLHNFLRKNSTSYKSGFEVQNDRNYNSDNAREIDSIASLQQSSKKNYSSEAKQNREEYLQFFNGKGKVEWQDLILNTGRA